jgi:rhamnogalacturonyl hydrolase YesR/lysophospholipase L1-like esterase
MRKLLFQWMLLATACMSFTTIAVEDGRPVFYIIGDSTVKNGKGKGDGDLWGWGSFLDGYFDTSRVSVHNCALGGRSSRTFITEGHWDAVLSTLKVGDFVIMQFGHNDGGPLDDTARARGTIKGTGDETKDIYNPIMKKNETVHTYGWYLRKYVEDIKARGATAIICSPIPRDIWVNGKCVRASEDYGKWAHEVAETTGAYFIDLNNLIANKYEEMGPEKVKAFFPGDHTHTNQAGAKLNTEEVVAGLKQWGSLGLTKYLLINQAVTTQEMPVQIDVLKSLRLANTYFMNKWPDPGKEIVTNIARPSHIWTRAVYYEGLMALYSIDPQKKYYDYAVDWGEKHQWTPRYGATDRDADDQCCGQTYIDLYGIEPRPERISAIKACMDNKVTSDKCDDWHWVDAIQMAMPVYTRLGVVLKDTSYFRKMYDVYHFTKYVHGGNGLYNRDEHLWWRDKDFVPPYKEPNGQNCYWSRGNGWVLAALVRVLSLLPMTDPHRKEYLQDYLDMVRALVPLQRADGFWNASLHDSTHFGGKELTGTALFTYGIGWGIRQGYLDRKQYLPVVAAAWNGLIKESLHDNGFLGFVQGTGKQPSDGQPVTYDKVPDFEDYGLGCFLLAGSEVYQLATPKAANMDEKLVQPYKEPDVLQAADGHGVKTTKEWEQVQRPYLYGMFEKYVYGRMPTGKAAMTAQVTSVDSGALDGLAIRKRVTLYFSGTDQHPMGSMDTAGASRLNVVIYLPRKRSGKAPVFVGYNFGGNATLEQSSQWPLKDILTKGYGVVTAWYWDIEPDRPDGWQTGIRTQLAGVLQIEPYEWGAIGAWAWGLGRIADYLQADKRVDPKRLIVMGHSRLGKTALWAAAGDPRWAMVIANESGEGGAALSKRNYGETIAIINAKFPWWFAPAYKQYGDDPAALPVDQPMLLSLIAPRPLYVASAEGDQWSDPKGEFLSAVQAGAAYGLYEKKGPEGGELPPLSQSVGGTIHYHIRPGKHDVTLYDWEQYIHFADQYLK